MKKKIVFLIAMALILIIGTCQAASYTLPEKMYNQLAIGSGLKGSFTVTAEGEAFRTPFLQMITDAEFHIRGIGSGKDLHYYVFQQDGAEGQKGVTELYRKDGVYYLRSDMVQGKVIAFPTASQYLDSLFPSGEENPSASTFLYKILTLDANEKKEKWDPVATRYQNELEMWLADFTVQAETAKMENGLTALDFIYAIPMNQVIERIVSLFGEFAADEELNTLLDTVMTKEEKDLYVNGNLLYYYKEALNGLDGSRVLQISKRVSAMGELLRFRLALPLDEKTTGYNELDVEKINELTVYTLKKTGETTVIALPDTEVFSRPEYSTSVWFSRIRTEADDSEGNSNLSVRIDAAKSCETHDDQEEKTHQTEQYKLKIEQDTTYLPEETDLSLIPQYEMTEIEAGLHYSSKYAQNSATTLEISVDVKKGGSSMNISAKLKTAAPWLFMPFEIIDPVEAGTDAKTTLIPYFTEWISNAASIIDHNAGQEEPAADHQEETRQEQEPEQNEEASPATENEENPDAEAAPIQESDESDG